MRKATDIGIRKIQHIGLVLATLIVLCYWGILMYRILSNFHEYYCSMVRHEFLGWGRYLLVGLGPILGISTFVLLLIPRTNLIGFFLSFFMLTVLMGMFGLAWMADWIDPFYFFQSLLPLLVSGLGIHLSRGRKLEVPEKDKDYETVWI